MCFSYCLLSFCRRKVEIREVTRANERCEVGEAPHWDVKTKSLFFVDIPRAEVCRYDSNRNEIFKAKIKDNQLPVSFIIPIDGRKDEFVVSTGLKVCVIRWNGKSEEASIMETLTQVDHDRPENRCNDAKVDPSGVLLYFGTMGDDTKYDLSVKRVGSLYRFSEKMGTKFVKGDIGISNGMAWDVKRRKFFYIDSMARDIKQFKYEPVYGEICEFHSLNLFPIAKLRNILINGHFSAHSKGNKAR